MIHTTTKEGVPVCFNDRNIETIYPHQSLPGIICIQCISGEEWHIKESLDHILRQIPEGR